MAPFVDNALLKGAVPAAVFWYLWFRNDQQPRKHSQLVATLLTVAVAIVAGRTLANFLPFRPRPLATPEVMGANVKTSAFFEDWSSMPSDHAVMFFTLAGCIFLIARREGIALFLHAAFFVCAARVLFGLHFLSDVVVGAVVGTAIAFAVMPVLTQLVQRLRQGIRWTMRPQVEYPLLFLVTFQFATMFDGARDLAIRAARFLF
ncbi:phosphatase PAP2 family protein [Paracoccus benzoatiresistens]|uniref:Phosphatase PAP2 family protein n=1 Tax=Paracoccus benzoatiresistens TaxID=2997341 RepID=A0ABT4J8H5_9RHOB|nr:phosphatase PAP2 family protein [Paracoccus sp. EF6]MCZ0962975.1 phosphatase PAP2 family protein [Paracoccus sp. EF6]